MPFGNITLHTTTYEPRKPGVYSRTGVSFSDPADTLSLRQASQRKDGMITFGLSRAIEKHSGVGEDLVQEVAYATLNLVVPDTGSYTSTELAVLVADFAEFCSAANLDRMALGEV